MINQFTPQDMSRIARTVLKSERASKTKPIPKRRWPFFPASPGAKLVTLTSDIEHDTTGTADDGGQELDVKNDLHRKLWNGSTALVVPTGDGFTVVSAHSATRATGHAVGDIPPGSLGSIINVTPIDGHLAANNLPFVLDTAHVEIKSGLRVWVELHLDNLWHAYAADCEEAG